LKHADTIVMAGARVADRTIQDPDLIQDHKVLIHTDVDPAEIGKNAGPTIPLVGSLKSIFEAFNAQEVQGDYKEWIDELDACREEESKRTYPTPAYGVNPRAFIRKLSLAMDDDGIYSADVGQNQILSCQNVVIRKGRFMTSGGMGTMGYALPASIGAKIAAPSRQSVAVCGDGAFQMTMMELSTAQQYDVPVKLVVMCNQTLGLVRQFQHSANHDRYIVTDLSVTPDLNKIAEAYHMNYIKVEKDEDVESAIAAFLKDDESALLECTVDKNIWV
ncbi:MAG: thiamine pyrophosphate-binding protein, partial [Lachnospiraceae bacterium]|nr:thiamine pyrophosphate-binding protein [Candidatus Equihabitans merdae]